MTEPFNQPLGFEDSREAFRQVIRRFKPTTYQQFRNLVIRHAVWLIHNMPDPNFNGLMEIGCAEHLAPVCHGLVRNHCAQLQPGQLGEFSEADLANALAFNLAYWFQEAAYPGTTPGWRMDNGVIVGSAIHDRIKRNQEAERQNEFWRRVGPVTAPGTVVKVIPDPTAELHNRADLTPETKVNVLQNYLDHFNSVGLEAGDGTTRHNFLTYHRRSLEAARRLFSVNPDLTAGHLIEVIQHATNLLCVPLPSDREDDTAKVLRKCNDLSYLLLLLRRATKEGDIEIPVERYLSKKELFGSSFNPDASPGADHPDRLALHVVTN